MQSLLLPHDTTHLGGKPTHCKWALGLYGVAAKLAPIAELPAAWHIGGVIHCHHVANYMQTGNLLQWTDVAQHIYISKHDTPHYIKWPQTPLFLFVWDRNCPLWDMLGGQLASDTPMSLFYCSISWWWWCPESCVLGDTKLIKMLIGWKSHSIINWGTHGVSETPLLSSSTFFLCPISFLLVFVSPPLLPIFYYRWKWRD